MRMKCDCEDFKNEIHKVNDPIINYQIRLYSGHIPKDIKDKIIPKTFKFCPWCGKELIDEDKKEEE